MKRTFLRRGSAAPQKCPNQYDYRYNSFIKPLRRCGLNGQQKSVIIDLSTASWFDLMALDDARSQAKTQAKLLCA